MRVLFRVAAALLIAAPAFLVLVIVFLLAARRRAPPRGSQISRSFERGVSVGPFSSCE
jgi:hypothetical protein